MGPSAELGFPFDIDHSGPAHESLGGYPGWPTKAEISHIMYRKPVDLTRGRSIHVYHKRTFGDKLTDTIGQETGAECLGLQGLLHMFSIDAAPGILF